MQMPPEGAATETLLDTYGEAHLVAVETEEETAALAPDFEEKQNNLRSALDGRKAAERILVRKDTLVYKSEAKLEGSVKQVEGRALLQVNKDRSAEPYVTSFPNGLLGALKPVGEAQAEEARRIAGCYPVESAPADIAALIPKLIEQADALVTRCKEAKEAEKALSQAQAIELTARRQWLEQYRKDSGLLIVIYPTDKKMVDSFFKSPRKGKKKPSR
jgi:hypothetical protein